MLLQKHKGAVMDYRVYEHTIGTLAHVDSEMEELEDMLADFHYTADEAEEFIKQWIPDTDRYGNKRRVYVYRCTSKVKSIFRFKER